MYEPLVQNETWAPRCFTFALSNEVRSNRLPHASFRDVPFPYIGSAVLHFALSTEVRPNRLQHASFRGEPYLDIGSAVYHRGHIDYITRKYFSRI